METMEKAVPWTDAIAGMWNQNYGPWLKLQPTPLIISFLLLLVQMHFLAFIGVLFWSEISPGLIRRHCGGDKQKKPSYGLKLLLSYRLSEILWFGFTDQHQTSLRGS